MKHTYRVKVCPKKMTEQQKSALITLHQQYIALSGESILAHLKNRNILYMYYLKDTHQLIATAGIQYVQFKNNIFVYIGNTVVDSKFGHEGCTAHAILRSMIYAFIRYPFKKKHWCALTSSAGSFAYSQRYQPCWPNPGAPTPPEITLLMEQCLKKIGIEKYKLVQGNIITDSLCDKVKQKFHLKDHSARTANTSYFYELNPGADKGEQLFFINSVRIYKLINAAIYSLHHKLVIQPKLYHKLKKCRNANSLLSGLLFLNSMISKKIKLISISALIAIATSFFLFM